MPNVDTAISIDHFIDCDRYYIENRSFFSTWNFVSHPFVKDGHIYRTKDVNQRAAPTWPQRGEACAPALGSWAASPARTLITPSADHLESKGVRRSRRHFRRRRPEESQIFRSCPMKFLAEVRGMPQRNLAFELLQKLLTGEIKTRRGAIWRRRACFRNASKHRCAAISGRPANGWATKTAIRRVIRNLDPLAARESLLRPRGAIGRRRGAISLSLSAITAIRSCSLGRRRS